MRPESLLTDSPDPAETPCHPLMRAEPDFGPGWRVVEDADPERADFLASSINPFDPTDE